MSATSRQMTIEDAKMLMNRVVGDSMLRRDLAENPGIAASAFGFSVSQESASFLAGLTSAGSEGGRSVQGPSFWA